MTDDIRWDKQPGFWPKYEPPASSVSDLVQTPSYLIDGYKLADAYMRDERAKRRAKP